MSEMFEIDPTRRRREWPTDFCGLKDYLLRSALQKRLRKTKGCGAIAEELNLPGDVRADLVESGRLLHGFEIKAGLDTLSRLPKQVAAYESVCDRCTIVTVDWHLPEVLHFLPSFWGILVMRPGHYDEALVEVRKAQAHDRNSVTALLQLLWYEELLAALRHRGLPGSAMKGSKSTLAARLASIAPLAETRSIVRAAITARASAQVAERERRADADFAMLMQQRRAAAASRAARASLSR